MYGMLTILCCFSEYFLISTSQFIQCILNRSFKLNSTTQCKVKKGERRTKINLSNYTAEVKCSYVYILIIALARTRLIFLEPGI